MKKAIIATLIGILFLSYFGALLVGSNLFGNLLSPVVTGIATYYVCKGYYLYENNSKLKVSGLFWGLSIFCWAICDFMWAIADLIFKIDPEQIGIISYSYSLTNILLLIGLVIAGYYEVKKWNGVQVFIDTITISICIMILVWVIFLNQDMKNILLMKNDWVAMASVVSNFLIFSWVAIWFFSIRKGKISLSLKISLVGVIIFFIADIIYYYQYFYSAYEPNSLLDGGYVLGFAFMAGGAIIKIVMQEIPSQLEVKSSAGYGREKGALLLAAPIILIIFRGLKWEYLVVMCALIMFYFIITSYVQKNIYRDESFQKEIKLNLELEKKVIERTKELEHLLNRDVITGLYSRRYFLEQLDKQIAELAVSENILLFYIDLNRYKMIKTMFGNYIGEKTLVEMGRD